MVSMGEMMVSGSICWFRFNYCDFYVLVFVCGLIIVIFMMKRDCNGGMFGVWIVRVGVC